MNKEPIEDSWVLEKINLMRKESADLILRQKAAELLLQNAPEVIRQNYDLNMQLAAWLYQEQDWTELLKLVRLIAVLEDASCFCWEKHPRRAEIFAALQKEEEWGGLFSTLKNSLQHNLNGEQLLELINYLNKLLLLSQNQKASLVLSKNGQKIKYDSQTFRDILAEETVQVAALALIKLLNAPGGTNIWLEHPEIWQTSELSEALLEALAVRPTSLALWLEANQETKVFPACLTREGQRIWPDILNRAKQVLQFDQKILQADSDKI